MAFCKTRLKGHRFIGSTFSDLKLVLFEKIFLFPTLSCLSYIVIYRWLLYKYIYEVHLMHKYKHYSCASAVKNASFYGDLFPWPHNIRRLNKKTLESCIFGLRWDSGRPIFICINCIKWFCSIFFLEHFLRYKGGKPWVEFSLRTWDHTKMIESRPTHTQCFKLTSVWIPTGFVNISKLFQKSR